MRNFRVWRYRVALWMASAACAAAEAGESAAGWPHWGGPRRDFSMESTGLAERWPATGPKELWSRPLGGGHACVLVEGERLYVGYRHASEEKDVYLCANAATGETIWESTCDAPMKPDMQLEFGKGPNATPALAGDRLFTVSLTAILTAFDKRDGKTLWSKDLMAEHQASHNGRGYSTSPVIFENLVIVNAGGPASGLLAFDQADGKLAWKTEPLGGGHATGLLTRAGDQPQLVVGYGMNRAGVDPRTGKVIWKTQVPQQLAAIISSPLWIEPDRVMYSCAYGGGTQLFQITAAGEALEPKELWHTRAFKVQHGNFVRLDARHVIGSSGDFGPAFLMCVEIDSGEVKWRERGFEKANFLVAEGKLLLLDQTGRLVLARADSEKFESISECKPLQERAWSVPTLVGTRLYLRDYFTLKCLDLSAAANP